MSEAPNWFFSPCAFIGFVLCAIPLPWHLEAWNTGTCLYMIWTGLQCLNLFINSVIWNSNVLNFMIGATVALPAASLCINRRLYHIVSVDAVTKTRAEKLCDVLGDLAIGLGIPVLEMILHYIVQGHRFNIFEEIGCYPATYNTPPAYALVWCWPVAIGVVSAVYCLCTIRELALRRAQFKELLSANRNMSSSRYFRLMGLAAIEVLGTIPIGAYIIYLNVTISPIQSWISWANTHYDFSRVAQYPSVVWHVNHQMAVSLQMSRYLFVACAFIFIFFSFFGFADEARRNYRPAYTSFAKKVGISTGIMSSGTWGTGSKQDMSYNSRPGMPVFITQRTDTNGTLSLLSLPTSLWKKQPYSATTSGGSISKDSLPTAAAATDVPIDFNDITLPAFPELTLDVNTARHTPDAPSSRRSSLDV
ncbi:pheromone A receptor-domain-containing protein [Pisolithus marmoratus]|nr:pheromone A receptor-domain-containing protein [Pisolithus marmoratus]